jgi:ABC-2 type transport system permease protein
VNGLAALERKELLESWRTRRLPVVAIVFVGLGILSPLTARYLPEIIDLAMGDQQIDIPIPEPTLASAVVQLQENLIQFGALAAIVLAMGLVAWEKDRGTAAFILSKPASRGAFLAAKAAALALVLGIAVLAGVAVGWVYTAVLFEPMPIPGTAAMGVLIWLSLMAWGSITFLASTVFGSAAAAAGVGIAALLSLSIASAIPPVARWLPAGLDAPGRALALGQPMTSADAAELATAVVGTVLIIAACLVVAWLSFRRQEL